MKKITLTGYTIPEYTAQQVALLEKVGKIYSVVVLFAACRGWMSDSLHALKTTGKLGTYLTKPSETFTHKSGHTYIGVSFNGVAQKKVFLSQLDVLAAKETQANVRKTKFYQTQDPLMLVAECSKYWKDSIWKIQLYTFYLRCMCYPKMSHYPCTWGKLSHKGNEGKLLSKIRTGGEYFVPGLGIHGQTGPDAICGGQNPYMAKLLGVTELNSRDY